MSVGFIPARIFLSTPSARRATRRHRPARRLQYDFYPRPPRGGRHWIKLKDSFMNSISIHALREEGDAVSGWATRLLLNFYPRPPRGGRRGYGPRASAVQLFLSTPSARRATPRQRHQPRAVHISIHALREEGDDRFVDHFAPAHSISIHALREEGDPRSQPLRTCSENFYPRPPRGGRPSAARSLTSSRKFLSTPSARRATRDAASLLITRKDFYPRPPRGGRRWLPLFTTLVCGFLSTPSARRATFFLAVLHPAQSDFYPRPPRGGRRNRGGTGRAARGISIHALREEGDAPQ